MPTHPIHIVRTFLALAAIVPGLVIGVVIQLFTGDRRRATNRSLDLWGRWGTRAAGIRLEVEHSERLENARPAVFIMNHRSGIDPILACALLRRDIFAVVKHEFRHNVLLGPAFAFAGVVFVRRDKPREAARTLEPAVAAIRAGRSLAITPEGTRHATSTLGPFKKGAFQIAMAAGVPVIPIVVANAEDVLPRRGWIMRPATVRVSVLEPTSTRHWTADTLEREIEVIRRAFEARLASL